MQKKDQADIMNGVFEVLNLVREFELRDNLNGGSIAWYKLLTYNQGR